jgi:peptide deformylase
MSVSLITTVPASILRGKAKKISRVDSSVNHIINDMIDTLHNEGGIGLAAPQINVPLRIIIIESKSDKETASPKIESIPLTILINPEIIKTSKEYDEREEGCLSIPNVWGVVRRHSKVVVRGLDKNGQKIKIKSSGLLARVLQHEIDHLDGILFTDKADFDTIHKITPDGKQIKIELPPL